MAQTKTGSRSSNYGASGNGALAASRQHGQNIGTLERSISALVGASLALWGLRRRDTMGTVGVATGLALVLRGATGVSLAKKALGDSPFEHELADKYGWSSAAVTSRSITINKPREEIYRLWRDFSNLPRFMEHIEHIDVISDRRSHWVVSAPAGRRVEWDAVVTEDRPDEYIAWESDKNADVRNAGWVEFRDAGAGRGTEVKAVIAYEPPGGQLGRLAAKLFGEEPGVQARDDLRRLKQLLETGEIPTSPMGAGQPGKGPRAAGTSSALGSSAVHHPAS